MRKIECSPSPVCRCCECQGKKCLMSHPGHDHRCDSIWPSAEEIGKWRKLESEGKNEPKPKL